MVKTNQQAVNSLNVFPVPDGDTGTNMVLTMQAAFEEVETLLWITWDSLHMPCTRRFDGGTRQFWCDFVPNLSGFARALNDMPTMDVTTLAKALT